MKNKLTLIINKYNGLSAAVKASLWFTICNFIQKGISFVTMPVFTRLLTKEQYGVVTVYNSWHQIISIFATLNLAAGVYNNCMTKYPDQKREITSSFQGLSTTVTSILFIIYISFMDFWTGVLELSPLFMICMFIELLFYPAYSLWSTGQRYEYQSKGIVLTTLVMAFGSPALGIVAVLSTDYKVQARILSYALIQIIIGLLFYIYNFKRGKVFFSKEYWLFAIKFNIPLLPHYLSMIVLSQADRIMISKMISSGAAAIYGVAYSVSQIMNIITSAINASFIPYTYKALKDADYKGIKNSANFLLLFVCGLSILAMACGPELVWFMGGKEYYRAIWVIPPVAASVFFTFLYPLFGNIEFYFEKTTFIMIASCTGAVMNIILNRIFIEKYDFYAAGYTTLVCYILFVVAHYIFHRRIIDQKIGKHIQIYDMKFIVILSIFEIVAMFCLVLIYDYAAIRYLIVIAMITIVIINRKRLIDRLNTIKKK